MSPDGFRLKKNAREKMALVGLLAAYLVFQLATIDYGTAINDFAPIRDYRVDKIDLTGTAMERNQISGVSIEQGDLGKWMMRFKLYSVEADEVYNIMALARIRPRQMQFDPHYYAYGGAYLYPLGGFYFFLSRLGLIQAGSLNALLSSPESVDAIYVWGRSFVLVSFVLSGFLLYRALRKFSSMTVSLLSLSIYLIAPASIMFSQVMKPHWWALIWSNGALFLLVGLFVDRRWSAAKEIALGILIGLSVGSCTVYGLFSILVWGGLVMAVSKRLISPIVLIRLPVVALCVFFITNPYILLNASAFQAEAMTQKGWFDTWPNVGHLFDFVRNSMLSGFGITVLGAFSLLTIRELVKPSAAMSRTMVVSLWCVVVLIGGLTASVSHWHINTRYIPYWLPCVLLVVGWVKLKRKAMWLAIVLFGLILQSAPLKLAYFDENDPGTSTRFLAAKWIAENIPEGAGICTEIDSLAPYNVPPLDFSKYRMNPKECGYQVLMERQPDSATHPEPAVLLQRFAPRYSFGKFPLVYSHINPQISIYRSPSDDLP